MRACLYTCIYIYYKFENFKLYIYNYIYLILQRKNYIFEEWYVHELINCAVCFTCLWCKKIIQGWTELHNTKMRASPSTKIHMKLFCHKKKSSHLTHKTVVTVSGFFTVVDSKLEACFNVIFSMSVCVYVYVCSRTDLSVVIASIFNRRYVVINLKSIFLQCYAE